MRGFRIMVVCGMLWMTAVCVVAQAPDLDNMDLVLKAVPDGPVAEVNGTMIGADDFKDLYVAQLRRFAQFNRGTPLTDEIRLRVCFDALRMLFERELLLQGAAKRALTVSEQELEEAWQKRLTRIREAATAGDEQGPTEQEVLDNFGATREEAFKELHEALLVEKMRKAIVDESSIEVIDEEIARWYEANKSQTRRPDMCRLRQIYVRTPRGRQRTPEKEAEAKQRAEDALKRVRSGESFESVVRDVSDGPGNAKEQGGDLGTGPVASLPEPVQKVVYGLKPGEVSDVIETTAGYHVFQLVEFTPGHNLSLEESTPGIRKIIEGAKAVEAVRTYCANTTNSEESIRTYIDLEKQLVVRPELAEMFSRRPQAPAQEPEPPAPDSPPEAP